MNLCASFAPSALQNYETKPQLSATTRRNLFLKCVFRFNAVLGLFVSLCLTAPTFAAPQKTPLPPQIRVLTPRSATSFLLQKLPIGPKSAMRIVHIWGATRPNTSDSQNTCNAFSASPFCVDIFAPDAKNRLHLLSSAAYLDTDSPYRMNFHWLERAKKQGPVLEIVSSNGAPGVSIEHTILAWDKGFGPEVSAPNPQVFASGGSGGGEISLDFAGVDVRGLMTVKSVNSYAGHVVSATIHRWDGAKFSAVK